MIVLSTPEAAAWVGLSASEGDVTAVLEPTEAALLEHFETETGWWFGETKPVVQRVNGRGGPSLWLPRVLSSLTSVEYRGGFAGGWQTLAAPGSFELDGRELYADDSSAISAFPRGRRNIRVTGTAGFADPPNEAPNEIKQWLREGIELTYRNRMLATPGVVEPGAAVLLKPTSKIARRILDSRRPVRIGGGAA